jgi:hypothetical protein
MVVKSEMKVELREQYNWNVKRDDVKERVKGDECV